MKKLVLILSIALVSCSNEKPVETTTPEQPLGEVGFQSVDSVTKAFVLPDSINTALIIATYVELDPESHTLIVYTNNDKKKATLIRYLNDGSVSTDKLEAISETVLRSTLSKNEYHINDSAVVFKMPNGHQEEHYRTDANN
jgi:hypothetical protein